MILLNKKLNEDGDVLLDYTITGEYEYTEDEIYEYIKRLVDQIKEHLISNSIFIGSSFEEPHNLYIGLHIKSLYTDVVYVWDTESETYIGV